MKLSKSTALSKPFPFALHSILLPSPPSFPGITVQEMASHIIALRRPYLHISHNPLNGNTLY